jgi:hypothetical protein
MAKIWQTIVAHNLNPTYSVESAKIRIELCICRRGIQGAIPLLLKQAKEAGLAVHTMPHIPFKDSPGWFPIRA